MRIKSFLPLLLLLGTCAVVGPPTVHGQIPATVEVSDSIWEIRLVDGSVLYGQVVEVSGEQLTILSASGVRVEVGRGQIRAMVPVRGVLRDGELWPADPNTTRLFFGPTGRMMGAGEGYIAAFELFLPFVSYSLTDRFTLAGGTPLVPGAIGELVYLAPKVGVYERPGVAISAGILAFFSTYNDFDSAGILYGVGTWGEPDRSFTFGTGWPFASGDMANLPVFMAGGEYRLSRRTKFVSENYLLTFDDGQSTNGGGLVSGGVRFIGDRLSADLGLGLALDSGFEPYCCVPLVNFVYHFGAER